MAQIKSSTKPEYLTSAQVRARFGVGRMWVERRMAQSDFPRPISFGTTRRFWRIVDVELWESAAIKRAVQS